MTQIKIKIPVKIPVKILVKIIILGVGAALLCVAPAFANPVISQLQIGQESVILEPGQTS